MLSRVLMLSCLILCVMFGVRGQVLAQGSTGDRNELTVFSDSLSDNGNLFAATGGAFPPPPYVDGRFSNGRVWVEYLDRILPRVRLDDRAVGGATTDTRNTFDGLPGGPFGGIQTQVAEFTGAGELVREGDLVVVFAGANNYLLGDTDPVAVVESLADAIVDLIQLADADRFVVPNLPNLGDTPFGRSQGPAASAALNALTAAHNAALEQAMADIRATFGVEILVLDTNGFFQVLLDNPRQFGFSTAAIPCFDQIAGTVCNDPKKHVFWDGVHPTTRAHFFFAIFALQGINTALGGGGN